MTAEEMNITNNANLLMHDYVLRRPVNYAVFMNDPERQAYCNWRRQWINYCLLHMKPWERSHVTRF